MLTKLRIRNFKQFEDVEIELGQSVVFIGPNNSGKTTALQALALWIEGLRLLNDRRNRSTWTREEQDLSTPALINRYDLTFVPTPSTELLWRNKGIEDKNSVDIRIEVEGITGGEIWKYSFSFAYENEESVRVSANSSTDYFFEPFPDIAFLPPMSGLIAVEPRLERGRIRVLLGEGRTAEVLRNLCLQIYETNARQGAWDKVVAHMKQQFGIELLPPQYISARGEIRMSYKDRSGVTLDLASSGRGMLQILLLLAYMYNNPGAVLLLDEPDAHLEILRQRQIYQLLTNVAQEQGSQIIAATHSEVVLDEAARRKDTIIAFIGKPHPVNEISDFRKSLDLIQTKDYYLSEQKGWVLYLEGSTDLDILRAFATRLEHKAANSLELAFVRDIEKNEPKIAKQHFTGLREAMPELVALALFDRVSKGKLKEKPPGLELIAWQRREIENYLISPEALVAFAHQRESDGEKRVEIMQELIDLLIPRIALIDSNDQWWSRTKATDEFLDRIFPMYFERLGLPVVFRKADYHQLVQFIPAEQIHPEVTEKLDAIVAVAERAQPRKDE